MPILRRALLRKAFLSALLAAAVAGCSPPSGAPTIGIMTGAKDGGAGGAGGTIPGGGQDAGPPPLTDFPTTPITSGTGVPANAAQLFATAPRTGSAPCLLAPQPNTLLPRNWLRPRFEYTPAAGENLFQITVTAPGFAHALTVYTASPTYTMDAGLWNGLRLAVTDRPIAVAVRAMTVTATGAVQTAPSAPASASFVIAPVDAPGKIVYWAIPNGASDGILRGFGIGEESVEDVLSGSQVLPPARSTVQNDGCIGCHSATPDGLGVGFVFGPHNTNMGTTYYDTVVDLQAATLGGVPSYTTATQLATVRTLRGIPAFSGSHWSAGDHIELLMDGQNHGDLLWVNLDTDGQQGKLARTGDSAGAVEPTFSHDGTRIAYVSASSIIDGRLANGPADLYLVPYADRAGGAATEIAGASDAAYTEYYPAFSPDDGYLAFSRIAGSGSSYSNPQSEVFVIPGGGGSALRLGANDPPACQTGVVSPGVTNDWPKWSPEATTAPNGKTYYWLTFSSTRSGRPQLYVAPMTIENGTMNVAYPAIYLWNQPSTDDNHTPSWDDYRIPPISIG